MRKNMLTETIRTYATSLKDSLLQLRQSGPKKESKSPIYTTSIQRSLDHLATPEVSQTHLAISTILIASQEELLYRNVYLL